MPAEEASLHSFVDFIKLHLKWPEAYILILFKEEKGWMVRIPDRPGLAEMPLGKVPNTAHSVSSQVEEMG